MSSVRHHRGGAARIALALSCCGLAIAAAGQVALADSGQARDMAAGGALPSHPSTVAEPVTVATSGSRPRGMSRAVGALPATNLLDQRTPAIAMLEKCVTASPQPERYAMFAGRMLALPGTTSMSMRIDVEERPQGQTAFRRPEGAGTSGLGSWRSSEPGVKIFKDVKQVTNLDAPVDYRAAVHFRWIGPKGVLIKREVLHTGVCHEPTPEVQVAGEAATARMPSR